MTRGVVGCLIAMMAASASAGPPDQALSGPAPEVRAPAVPVDLPPIPAFDLPAGPMTVKALRVWTKHFLGTRVALRGFVTFAYDCATDIRKVGESDRAVKARIDADPSLCERPKLYLGDAKTTPHERSLWVVDVPRPYNKLELSRIPKADRTMPDRCEPHEKDPKKQICPPYHEGDEVVVIGELAVRSPHAEANTDGLLVYEAMQNVTQHWQTPGVSFGVMTVTPPGPPPAPPKLPKLVDPAPRAVSASAREASVRALADGNKALGMKDLSRARTAYESALAQWDGDHLAWYGLAMVEMLDHQPAKAVEAFDHCVAIAPREPMYQMFDGVARFEAVVADARAQAAAMQGMKPEDVDVDLSQLPFDEAELHLRQAIALEPGMWRAHYYLGKIQRAHDRAKQAADEFAAAIRANPREVAPFIALAELLLKWDYDDQAIQVAKVGTTTLPASADTADVWYELGMGYDAKAQDEPAVEAFSKALDLKRDHAKALFQRGQAYFHMADLVRAKADLEAFLKTGNAFQLALARQQANRMLMDIAAKARAAH